MNQIFPLSPNLGQEPKDEDDDWMYNLVVPSTNIDCTKF